MAMTLEESRKKFPYRPHTKYAESRWGGNSLCDDEALLLSEDAKRCESCNAPTRVDYLVKGICLDCRML